MVESPAPSDLQLRAERLAETRFVGGPVEHFEMVGRNQLAALLGHGLNPESKVLDVGCGCLRGGYWIMRLLEPGRYFGIEPNDAMLQAGLEHIVERKVLDRARPRFDNNDRFDFSVFGSTFDFVLARSVWTHAAKPHVEAMLDSFLECAAPNAVFLTSVWPGWRGFDYRGTEWVGRSHDSDVPGMIVHRRRWIRRVCHQRGLEVARSGPNVLGQRWLAISAT